MTDTFQLNRHVAFHIEHFTIISPTYAIIQIFMNTAKRTRRIGIEIAEQAVTPNGLYIRGKNRHSGVPAECLLFKDEGWLQYT